MTGKSRGRKGQRPPHGVAVACEALYRALRELPLQVGPGGPGGTAFCTRSWQVFRFSIETVLARSSGRAPSPRRKYGLQNQVLTVAYDRNRGLYINTDTIYCVSPNYN